MPEFPLAGHSETVSKILSSILPPRAYTYLIALLPGFFLEVSVCLGNPTLVQQLIGRSNQAANLGRYPKIMIAVFLAYVIGQAFILWTNLLYQILERLFRIRRFLWRSFCKWPLLPFVNWRVLAHGWLSRQHWFSVRLVRRIQVTIHDLDADSEGVRKLWGTLAKGLYDKHYGIDLQPLEQEEWDALYQASSGLSIIRLGDHMFMVAIQAVGWSGLAAIRFAPALLNRQFVAFNAFLIGIGILYQWQLIRSVRNEYTFGLLRVRGLIRELRKSKPIRQAAAQSEEPEPE